MAAREVKFFRQKGEPAGLGRADALGEAAGRLPGREENIQGAFL
jgi:hypothetical protein